MSKIQDIKAREILDSRKNPTIEVKLKTDSGKFLASVPSGASKGKYEALELRNNGKGVLKAIKNVNEIIGPKLKGEDPSKQKKIDEILINLDGTENKSRLGANAICGVSLAVCRAGTAEKNISLWEYISNLSIYEIDRFPIPCFNLIEGGAHTKNDLDFQEFMIVPYTGISRKFQSGRLAQGENRPQRDSFAENLRIGSEIYNQLKENLSQRYNKKGLILGDEGGFSAQIKLPEEAIEFILKAARDLNYQNEIKILLDIASSQFYDGEHYKMKIGVFTREDLNKYYSDLISKYPILGLEDPFSEEDWQGWQDLNAKCLIIGDDLTVTNPKRIKMAKEKKACNGVIIKINQIGTLTEAIEAVKLAKSYGWKTIVSHRSGETNDDFIADFSVGVGADFIKAGAPAQKERMAKYKRLLEIEKEIQSIK